MSPERRHFTRIHFQHQASLTAAVGCRKVDVQDISLKGVLVSAPAGWAIKVGSPCSLELPLDDSVAVKMEGTLVHIENGTFGIRCDRIDLDSISHLRRLIELNLGDEEMLQRELSALIQTG